MRVMIVLHSLRAGGAERVAANLANAWADRGWHVALVTIASRKLDAYDLHSSVKRIALDSASHSEGFLSAIAANLRRVHRLRVAIRGYQPNVVVALTTTAAVLSSLATRGIGCRLVVSERVHPPSLSIPAPWFWLRRITYPWATRVVMQASEGLAWLNTHIPGAKGLVIPNPVIFPMPCGEPVVLPEQVLRPERRLLLAVGRLDNQKGFDLLVNSFASIANRYPTWDLVIVGEGPERTRLENQVREHALGERVALPGRIGNIGDWYGHAELYVMSSRFEGFPNTLLEAMAHGRAAVSYDCDTGPRDIVRHEVNGLLVRPVGDVSALSNGLDRLMGNEALRRRMGAKAQDVRERFAMKRILGMWDEVLHVSP